MGKPMTGHDKNQRQEIVRFSGTVQGVGFRYITHRIAQRYDISRSGVWLWVKKGILPKPIRISPGCTRFDIEACDEAISYKAQAA